MPAPVPLERKRARGNPGKRALPSMSDTHAVAPLSESDVPANLGPAGREAWTRTLATAPWLSDSDAPTLMMLCEKADRRAEMVEALKRQPLVLVAERTGFHYANPLVGMISTIETDMTKLLSVLGLTPTDRSRLGLAEVKAQSTLEKLRKSRG